jgi:hypothetical protein
MTGMFSYFRGLRKKRKKSDLHNTTVGIEESGNFGLGEGQTKHYTMVATVIPDYKKFEKTAKEIPNKGKAPLKSSDAGTKVRRRILMRVTETVSGIHISSYKKSEITLTTSADQFTQYSKQVKELLDMVFTEHWGPVFDILFDSNSIVSKEREEKFIKMCNDAATAHGKKIDWIEMMSSNINRALQVIDYPANVIGTSIENSENDKHTNHDERKIIKDKEKK